MLSNPDFWTIIVTAIAVYVSIMTLTRLMKTCRDKMYNDFEKQVKKKIQEQKVMERIQRQKDHKEGLRQQQEEAANLYRDFPEE
ncbi:MAG: hypothetical protein MPJ24_05255 [Pirellulaceae bacterium]|nr:hypothetical protein [Pirellulaceae bacterium]